jgi:ABC-type amino acid transport substrate-binding protein
MANEAPGAKDEPAKDLETTGFWLTPHFYLRLTTLVTLLLWTIGATYYVTNDLLLGNLREKATVLSEKTKDDESQLAELNKEYSELKLNYDNTLRASGRPHPKSPKDEALLVADQVEFTWDYIPANQSIPAKYILELRNLSTKQRSVRNVLNPDLRLMDIAIPPEQSGAEYLWRVRPGRVLNISNGPQQEIAEGPWSEYNSFTIYPSVEDRIRNTGILRIAVSPSSTGFFNFLDNNGDLVGLDRDLMNWLGLELGRRFHLSCPLAVSTLEESWTALLPSLRNNDVDLVISSMTSTKPREKANRITFSNGYFHTHQIIIARPPRTASQKCESAPGMTLGVVKGTTNEQAAKYLTGLHHFGHQSKYPFTVASEFVNFDNGYEALIKGDVDLLLVDDVNALNHLLDHTACRVEIDLDADLEPFYQSVLGREKEEYAIGVNDAQLVMDINDLLHQPEGQKELGCLRDKWIARPPKAISCEAENRALMQYRHSGNCTEKIRSGLSAAE